jgi:diguanylate cyclase (GGDEF)-like protein
MKVSQYASLPVVFAALLLCLSWWVVYQQTETLRQTRADSATSENLGLRIRAFENEVASLLLLGDLIVASRQTFLLLPFEEHVANLTEELEQLQASMKQCCDTQDIKLQQALVVELGNIVKQSSNPSNQVGSADWLEQFDAVSSKVVAGSDNLREQIEQFQVQQVDVENRQEKTYLYTLLSVVIGSVFTLSLLAWWLVTGISNPVARLSRNARQALSGESFTGVADGPVEIRQLSASLTTLTNDLESALEQERIKVMRQQEQLQKQAIETAAIQKESLDRLDVVIRAARAVVWEWIIQYPDLADEQNTRDQALRLFQTGDDEEQYLDLNGLAHDEWNQLYSQLVAHIQHSETLEVRVRLAPAGPVRWHQLNGQVVEQTESYVRLVGSIIDMHERIEQETQVRQMALTDSLTQVANRRQFADIAQQWIQDGRSFCLLAVDINDFKIINDRYGHICGDKALQYLAQVLVEAFGPKAIVARLGGDEYSILWPGINQYHVELLIEQVVSMANAFSLSGSPFPLSLSFGLARYPDDSESLEALMSAADLALYQTKELKLSGVTHCWYRKQLGDAFDRQLRIKEAASRALKDHALTLALQPIWSVEQNKVYSFEALLRWENSFNCSTGELIDLAQQSGLILAITEWVIREAARASSLLRAQGITAPISINLPAHSFRHQDVVSLIRQACRKFDLPFESLSIEITESVFLEDTDSVIRTVKSLANLGIETAIDDFGTGYSSLSYLHVLDAQSLKIDRSFVAGITADDPRAPIVRSTIQLGQALGMAVVAEGIETEEELNCVVALGCSLIQGYYFHKPAALDVWLTKA